MALRTVKGRLVEVTDGLPPEAYARMDYLFGDRQVSSTLEGVRKDHRARYEFAATFLREHGCADVLDAACGVGYGANIMAHGGLEVFAIDIEPEAVGFGIQKWAHPSITWAVRDVREPLWKPVDAVVAFELIEHMADPEVALAAFREVLRPGEGWLIASTPNETVYPFVAANFVEDEYPHVRHYTPAEFVSLLEDNGFHVERRFSQETKHSDVDVRDGGRFLVYCARAA